MKAIIDPLFKDTRCCDECIITSIFLLFLCLREPTKKKKKKKKKKAEKVGRPEPPQPPRVRRPCVKGNGHFFPSCRQLYLSSFSDTHTHTHTHTHARARARARARTSLMSSSGESPLCSVLCRGEAQVVLANVTKDTHLENCGMLFATL